MVTGLVRCEECVLDFKVEARYLGWVEGSPDYEIDEALSADDQVHLTDGHDVSWVREES